MGHAGERRELLCGQRWRSLCVKALTEISYSLFNGALILRNPEIIKIMLDMGCANLFNDEAYRRVEGFLGSLVSSERGRACFETAIASYFEVCQNKCYEI